jgi:hypothetical protein
VSPSASVTFSVSRYVLPPEGSHSRVIRTPVFGSRLATYDVQLYETIPWSSVDGVASSMHLPGLQVTR